MTLKLIIVWYFHWLTKVMLRLAIVERTSQPRHVSRNMANDNEAHLPFGKIDFALWTNTFGNLEKYILPKVCAGKL